MLYAKILESKHPKEQRPPLPDEEPPIPPAPTFDRDQVCKQIRRFPKGSAGGPDGLRPQHLKDAIRPTLAACSATSAADLVNVFVSGRAPLAMAPYLAGARLAALGKDDGDVRPIAVGSTWRRTPARCLCAETRNEATKLLAPLQVGVGLSMGGEAFVHVVRQWCERHRDCADAVLCLLDWRNAFQGVCRRTFKKCSAPGSSRSS
eukprot:gene11153-biopygen103053